jgi:hypothetical protein
MICDVGMHDNILESFAKNCVEPAIYAGLEKFSRPFPSSMNG